MYQVKWDQPIVRPVRRVGVTRRSVSGTYAFRGTLPVQFESTLERDFVMRAEFFTAVAQVVAQPVTIDFRGADGRPLTYTPDYLVYYHLDGRHLEDYPRPLLVEVKPEAEWRAHWREWSTKWKAARTRAREEGWTFRIFDESRIRDQVLSNIRFIERYQRMDFCEEESLAIIETVRQMGSVPFHYLLARHFVGDDTRIGIAHLWHLLAARRLDCDPERAFDHGTELWVSDHG